MKTIENHSQAIETQISRAIRQSVSMDSTIGLTLPGSPDDLAYHLASASPDDWSYVDLGDGQQDVFGRDGDYSWRLLIYWE